MMYNGRPVRGVGYGSSGQVVSDKPIDPATGMPVGGFTKPSYSQTGPNGAVFNGKWYYPGYELDDPNNPYNPNYKGNWGGGEGGSAAPGPRGEGQGLAQPPTAQAGQRPFYMNYDAAALMELVRRNPAFKDLLPPEVRQGFPNEYFLEHPEEQSILTPERRMTFGQGALAAVPGRTRVGGGGGLVPGGFRPLQEPGGGAGPAPWTTGTQPGQPGDTRSAAAGDKTGYLIPGGTTGISLREPDIGGGKTTELSPAVAAPITGARMPTYRTSGGVPVYSAQALARMMPGERAEVSSLVNRAGGRAEDYFEQQKKLFSSPRGSGVSYARGRRY